MKMLEGDADGLRLPEEKELAVCWWSAVGQSTQQADEMFIREW
jgi:hypothetical protein